MHKEKCMSEMHQNYGWYTWNTHTAWQQHPYTSMTQHKRLTSWTKGLILRHKTVLCYSRHYISCVIRCLWVKWIILNLLASRVLLSNKYIIHNHSNRSAKPDSLGFISRIFAMFRKYSIVTRCWSVNIYQEQHTLTPSLYSIWITHASTTTLPCTHNGNILQQDHTTCTPPSGFPPSLLLLWPSVLLKRNVSDYLFSLGL